jgi:hypothetical protein
MRNLKFLVAITGITFCVLFFGSMMLFMVSIPIIAKGKADADDVFLIAAAMMVVSMPIGLIYQRLEDKWTTLRYRQLSQQGVPVTWL